MYKVIGKENDMFKVLDLDKGTEELLSAEDLVLALGQAEIDGCQHSENGIEVWYDGVEKYEISIEVWAPIDRFNFRLSNGCWRYEVSNLGRIRSIWYYKKYNNSRSEHIMTPVVGDRYLQVCLCNNGEQKNAKVHILVSSVFVYNPLGLPVINHKNEDKLCNKAFNLEWCTQSYNVNYGTANLRRRKTTGSVVRQYSFDGKLIKEYASINEAMQFFGTTSSSAIIECCKRINKFGFNSVWRYIIDDELYGLSEMERSQAIAALLGDKYDIVKLEDGSLTVERHRHVIRQYTKDKIFICEYQSEREVIKAIGSSRKQIASACNRVWKSHRGFIWRYAHDDEFADHPENAKAIKEWREAHNV